MKQKPRLTLEVLVVSLLVLCGGFAAWLAVLLPARLCWLPLALLAVGLLAAALLGRQIRALAARWTSGRQFEDSRLQYSLADLPVPALVLLGKAVLWYNDAFRSALLGGDDCIMAQASRAAPGLNLRAACSAAGQLLVLNGRTWHIHGTAVPENGERVHVLYFHDETALRNTEKEYFASRPGCILFMIDGYDDVFGDMLDSERAGILEDVNRVLEEMIGGTTGFLRRIGNGRYLAVVEERHLKAFADQRYTVLDSVRAIAPQRNLSLSIGVGRGGQNLAEAQLMASQALDMAQGRGGDQAAEKTPDGFTFYGGVSHGVEKSSRVKSRLVAAALVELIKQADSVVIMGHSQSDLDAIGAAEGVLRICKICDVPAVIAVRRGATLAKSLIDAFDAAGCADDFIEPEQALEVVTRRTLCIVVDTYRRALVESTEILDRCGSVAVIDHHRKAEGFIENAVLVCHEPYASSASELVTELLQYVGGRDDKPTRVEAEGLLAGIMLDTRSFSLHTGVRTFEAAAVLRRHGAETERVKALFNTSLEEYKAKCALVEGAQTYKGCALSVSGPLPPGMKVAVPQAANDLLSIEGVQASFVAVQNPGGVSVSARSMGEVNVQVIMEALGGGGHQTMAGGQLRGATPEEAYKKICAAIDLYRAAQAQSAQAVKK